MERTRTRRDPWFALATATLGLITLYVIAGSWASLRPAPAPIPAPDVHPVQVIVTIPPWPTPRLTATPTPFPRVTPVPTATAWPVYDPRFATPGRLYQVPPPTPLPPTPYPACDLRLPAGTRCVAVAPTATPQAQGGRR